MKLLLFDTAESTMGRRKVCIRSLENQLIQMGYWTQEYRENNDLIVKCSKGENNVYLRTLRTDSMKYSKAQYIQKLKKIMVSFLHQSSDAFIALNIPLGKMKEDTAFAQFPSILAADSIDNRDQQIIFYTTGSISAAAFKNATKHRYQHVIETNSQSELLKRIISIIDSSTI